MKKKYLSLLLSLIMLISVIFTACGNKPDETKSAKDITAENTGSADKSSLKPEKLVMIFPTGATMKDLPEIQAEMNKYLKEKINATIEIRPIDWGSWRDKTNLMFASSEQIDLMFTSSWLYLGQQAAKGQLNPVDDLLEKYGQGIKAVLDPAVVQGGQINGKSYAVVTNKEFAADKGIAMRKDLIEKYKVDLSSIKAPKDLEPVFEAIKKNEPGLVPMQCKWDESLSTMVLGFGVFDMLGDGPGVLERNSKDLKVIDMYETPIYMEYAKLMHKWFNLGYINKDAATQKDTNFNAVKAGKAFSYPISLKPGIDLQESRNTGMPMVTVSFTKPFMTTGDTTSAMFAIPTTSKAPERAMMFLNLLFTDKYPLNLLDWGIENKHYVKKSENIIDFPQGVDAKTSGYSLFQSWMFGNQLNSYLWTTEDVKLWEKYKEYNTNADKSPALGFVFDPEKVKTEIAALTNASDQYVGAINTGTLDPEKVIPQFVDKLKAVGVEKVITEKQRQLDEWAKKNKK